MTRQLPTRHAGPIDLDRIQVLSLDLFDTLLLRTVATPVEVFPLVARRARAQGRLRPHVTEGQFAAVRRSAEDAARRSAHASRGSAEVTLRQIYAAMPRDWFEGDAAAMAALELDVECGLAYANPVVHALVVDARARGVTTILTSDTTFSAADLSVLLQAAGISPGLFDHIITSSDRGHSKHDGTLFKLVLSLVPGVEAASVLHLGDHPHADVRQARRAGINGVAHDNGQAAFREVRQLETLRYGDVLPELHPLRALAGTAAAGTDDTEAWWFRLGASVLGPTFAAFADWVLDECVRDGITTIRPLMREGALFSALLSRAAGASGLTLDIAPLYASRSATWLASLDTFDDDAVARLLQRQQVTVGEALSTLGLTATGSLEVLAPFRALLLRAASATTLAGGATVAAVLTTALQRPDVRQRVEARMAAERLLLDTYLDASCGSAADVALVDLGFRGSIGLAIEGASRTHSTGRYHQFLTFAADKVATAWHRGADIRVFGAGPMLNADLAGAIARHPAPLESLLVGGGTTSGYAQDADRVEPLLDADRTPAAQASAAATCRDGILAFQTFWLGLGQQQPQRVAAIRADRRGLVAPVHRLLTLPTADEAARLGALLHEDNDGGRSMRLLSEPGAVPAGTSPDAFLRATLSGGDAFGRSWLWPAGTCAQRWPGYAANLWSAAVGAIDGAAPAVPALSARMRQDGIRACVVWGAGEAGVTLVRTLRRDGLDVLCVTDSNPSLWGTQVEGVPVVSPADARERGNDVFAIGSFAFAPEIERTLRGAYQHAQDRVRIFSLAAGESA